MNKTALFIPFICLLLVSLQSCVKDPNFPIEPIIEYKSVDKTFVSEGESVQVFLDFQDGDGDLGKNPNIDNATCTGGVCDMTSDSSCFFDPFYGVFILDDRDNCMQFYSLPDLEPDGDVKDIEGEVELRIQQVRCKFPNNCTGCMDTVTYEIILKDQAQHYTNSVYTDMIIVTCD